MPVYSGPCAWKNAANVCHVTVDLGAGGTYGRIVVATHRRTYYDAMYRQPYVPPLGRRGGDIFDVTLVDPYEKYPEKLLRCAAKLYRSGDDVTLRLSPRRGRLGRRLPSLEARLGRIHAEDRFFPHSEKPRRWSRPRRKGSRSSWTRALRAVAALALAAAAAWVVARCFAHT